MQDLVGTGGSYFFFSLFSPLSCRRNDHSIIDFVFYEFRRWWHFPSQLHFFYFLVVSYLNFLVNYLFSSTFFTFVFSYLWFFANYLPSSTSSSGLLISHCSPFQLWNRRGFVCVCFKTHFIHFYQRSVRDLLFKIDQNWTHKTGQCVDGRYWCF